MNKIFFIILILLMFLSFSVISAENWNDSNINNQIQENATSSLIKDLDKSYDISQDDGADDNSVHKTSNINQKIKSSSSDNLMYSQKVSNNEEIWHINVHYDKIFASNMSEFNVSIDDGTGKTLNKGSLNYYLNDILIGKSLVKNNKSHLEYFVPEEYNGIYFFKVVYIDENNKITNHSYIDDYLTIYPKDSLFLDAALSSSYPFDYNNTIKVYLTDIKGNIVSKSGYLDVILRADIFTPEGYGSMDIPIGTYDFINGSSSFNLFINSSSDWVMDFTDDMYLILHFHDVNENKDYYLKNYRQFMKIMRYQDLGIGNAVINESTNTVRFTFIGNYNYEDSVLLIYINGKYMTSLKIDAVSGVTTYDYKIPENFTGMINLSAKRVTSAGYNTSFVYKDSVNAFKRTKITGINVSGYAGQIITFKGKITYNDNPTVNWDNVILKLNGKTINADTYYEENNTFSSKYKIPENFTAKNYKITYVSIAPMGYNDYSRSEDEKTLTVTAKPTKIIADNVSTYAGQTVNINGTIMDINNNPVKSGRVVLKLNGKTINSNITLNNSNYFTYKFKVPDYTAKDYVLTYVYVGDKNCQRSELNKTFTIKSQESKITANSIIDYQEQTVTLTVKIVGAKTGINAVKGTVGFKINGKTVKINGKPFIQNVTNGIVVFKYKIPSTFKADKYQIMVTYSGGRYLLGAKTNTSTLTVKDYTTKILIKVPAAKQGQRVRLLAYVNDSCGKIKSGSVTFKLNNKIIGTSNITSGLAVLYYTIPNNYLGNYLLEVLAQGTYTDFNYTKTTLKVSN